MFSFYFCHIIHILYISIFVFCVCVCVCVCAQSLSHVPLFVTTWTPGSFVHGIFPARILEHVFIFYSRDVPNPGIKSRFLVSPVLAGRIFTSALPGKSRYWSTSLNILSMSTRIYNSSYFYVFGYCVVWYFITFSFFVNYDLYHCIINPKQKNLLFRLKHND